MSCDWRITRVTASACSSVNPTALRSLTTSWVSSGGYGQGGVLGRHGGTIRKLARRQAIMPRVSTTTPFSAGRARMPMPLDSTILEYYDAYMSTFRHRHRRPHRRTHPRPPRRTKPDAGRPRPPGRCQPCHAVAHRAWRIEPHRPASEQDLRRSRRHPFGAVRRNRNAGQPARRAASTSGPGAIPRPITCAATSPRPAPVRPLTSSKSSSRPAAASPSTASALPVRTSMSGCSTARWNCNSATTPTGWRPAIAS